MQKCERTIGIYPTSHGFGFVVFECENILVDWGHASSRPATNTDCLERMAAMFSWYTPTLVVIEDTSDSSSRRGLRVKALLKSITKLVQRADSRIETILIEEIANAFFPDRRFKKYDLAQMVAAHYPELNKHLPPPRKIWMSEDERMSIFLAAALVLTFFHKHRVTTNQRFS